MRGFPKHINTKADVDYLTAHPEFTDQMKTKLEVMSQDSKKWALVREVAVKEVVPISETVKVIEEKQSDGTIKQYLCELKDDPTCVLKRLGIEVTAVEVKVEEIPEEVVKIKEV